MAKRFRQFPRRTHVRFDAAREEALARGAMHRSRLTGQGRLSIFILSTFHASGRR